MAESLDPPAYALKALLNHKGGSDVTGGYLMITAGRLRDPIAKIEDYVLKTAEVKNSAEIVVLSWSYGSIAV